MLVVTRSARNMSSKYIVPIDSKEEELEYVLKMYCTNCKGKGSVEIEVFKDVIEEGYHYEIARCICDKCNKSLEVKFFPTDSCINTKIKSKNNSMSKYTL